MADPVADPEPGPGGRLTDAEVEERLDELDELLAEVEAIPGRAGEAARDAVSALAAVYGEALARTLAAGADAGAARRLVDDPLVGHLLALHGLHPDPPEQRAARAVAEIGDQLQGGVSLDGVDGGVARITLAASGCGSGELAASVRDIVIAAAPELAEVEATSAPATSAFIPVQSLHRARRP